MTSTDPSSSATDGSRLDWGIDDVSAAQEFRRAWQQDSAPVLEVFVAQKAHLSPRDLAALIRIDLNARWRRNMPQPAEDYLGQYSRVAENAELALDVIYAEYLAREQSGEQPDVAEYQRRFPQYADVLFEQISLHRAVEALEGADESDNGNANVGNSAQHAHDRSRSDENYQILEPIGRGGMGVVYKARQPALNRFVALKMVRAIDASNHELLARFRSEARVVAALDHPHIVKIYDYGEHEGLPYIAMELIEGGSLADRLDGTPWQPRDAAKLLSQLAGAVQFAHECHVVHRDLKPANVLIASATEPLDVRITDFGLAKFYAEGASSHTQSNALFGTPSYMAPEQARGQVQKIGPASDLYSLGAILYELLTGRPPFRGSSPVETLQLVLSTEPVSTHRMAPRVPRDLATICDKCLRGEIERRYATAGELREDLERFLTGLPIRARRIGAVERTWRWCRRNPSLAGALASIAFLLLSTAAVALWYSGRLSNELSKTRSAIQVAQERLWDAYIAEVNARQSSQQVGQRFAALETVDRAAALLETMGRSRERELQLRNAVLSAVALPDLRPDQTIAKLPAGYYACDLSTAADCYAISTSDGQITVSRISDGKQRAVVPCAITSYFEPVLSPDARFVAAVSQDTTQVWRIDGAEPRLAWEAAGAQLFTFSPDGQQAAYSDPASGMRLVNVLDGTELRKIGQGHAESRFAFHAATHQVAVCGPETVQVIDLDTGRIATELPMGPQIPKRIAWHPHGEYLAVWSDTDIVLWNVTAGTKTLNLPHRGVPHRLIFNNEGSLLASQSLWDSRLLVWDIGTGQRVLEQSEFAPIAGDAADGGRIAFLAKQDDQVRLTVLETGACRSLPQSLDPPLGWWYGASISPEGRIVALSSNQGLELWDLQTTRRLLAWPIGPSWAQFDVEGRLALGCEKGVYQFACHVQTTPQIDNDSAQAASAFATVIRLGPPRQLSPEVLASSLAINESGRIVLFQDSLGWTVMPSGNDGGPIVRPQTKGDPRKGAVSNDDKYIAIANWESGGASVWDASSGVHLVDLAVGQHGVLRFSPDDRWLAATPDGVTVWETSQWQRVHQLDAHGTTPTGLGIAFSPDSRVLAVGQTNGVLKWADPQTGNEWAQLSLRELRVATTIAFSPQQRQLLTASTDENSPARVWDLVALRRELAARGLDLPADVLRVQAMPRGFEGELKVQFDDNALFETRPALPRGKDASSPDRTENTR